MAKKRKSVMRRKSKGKILHIDMSEWDLDEHHLADLITVERSDWNVTVKLNFEGKKFDKLAEKIAEDAFRMYFSEVYVSLTKEGIAFQTGDYSEDDILIPWDDVFLDDWEPVKILHSKAKEREWIAADHQLPDPLEPTD